MNAPTWAAGIGLAVAAVALVPGARAQKAPADNAELTRMFQEDQDDRNPGPHGIDWKVVKPRDDARLARTRELYTSRALRTGTDWYHAALILQHGSDADDYLLAHEMSVAAVALGEKNGRSLAAAAEDRFLRAIGRKQRFGTQYVVGESGKFELAETEAGVTDQLRDVMATEPLEVSKATASRFDKK